MKLIRFLCKLGVSLPNSVLPSKDTMTLVGVSTLVAAAMMGIIYLIGLVAIYINLAPLLHLHAGDEKQPLLVGTVVIIGTLLVIAFVVHTVRAVKFLKKTWDES